MHKHKNLTLFFVWAKPKVFLLNNSKRGLWTIDLCRDANLLKAAIATPSCRRLMGVTTATTAATTTIYCATKATTATKAAWRPWSTWQSTRPTWLLTSHYLQPKNVTLLCKEKQKDQQILKLPVRNNFWPSPKILLQKTRFTLPFPF